VLGTCRRTIFNDAGILCSPSKLFWRIVAAITGNETPLSYSEKKNYSYDHTLRFGCLRIVHQEGSLDTAIQDERPNDLEVFLQDHTTIRTIAFNGNKAATLFDKYLVVKMNSSISYCLLQAQLMLE